MKYLKYFEDNVPQNVPIQNQLHVFDFDDTLGVTKNANGVMLYNHGVPAHKTPEEVLDWLSKYGFSKADLIPGPDGQTIQFFDNLGGCAAYVDSTKLAVLTGCADFKNDAKRYTTGYGIPPANIDQALYIDFTPSGNIDQKDTIAIGNVIKKLTDMEEKGADTMVLTARKADGVGINFKGEEVPITNKKDIEEFLKKHDPNPSTKAVDVVVGLGGEADRNKGNYIYKYLAAAKDAVAKEPKDIKTKIKRLGEWPDEIHFYDDASQNTSAVDAALGNDKVPSELYIYGPGDFHGGKVLPNKPTKK